MAEFHKEQYGDAITDIDSAIDISPNNIKAWYNLGYIKYDHGDYAGAETDFDEVLKRNNKYARAYLYKGFIDIKAGKKETGYIEIKEAAGMGLIGGADSVKKYCK